jgi:Na+-transporting NADH:ubiquinone oxidoreductase subunit NqrB
MVRRRRLGGSDASLSQGPATDIRNATAKAQAVQQEAVGSYGNIGTTCVLYAISIILYLARDKDHGSLSVFTSGSLLAMALFVCIKALIFDSDSKNTYIPIIFAALGFGILITWLYMMYEIYTITKRSQRRSSSPPPEEEEE